MLLEELKKVVGPTGWTTNEADLEPHLTEWRGAVRGKTVAMVSPATTADLSSVVRLCFEAGVAVVPQGGNTGMCAGAVPDESGEQVLLNLSRLNRIRSINPDDFSMVVEAGCILADVRRAASDSGRFFPLSIGGEGSSQIGGNLSTNAGGINVIRYGTARNLVLGLEVVLADGTVWHGLKSLRKDTAGYDLKQLFVGSEGTLGVITAATLKLFPDPGETATALLALEEATWAVSLLDLLQSSLPDRIQAFELIGARPFRYVLDHIPDTSLPFDVEHPWYVLLELAAPGSEVEDALAIALDCGLAADVVVAKSRAESERFWRMRHSISEAEKLSGPGLKHDVSVPIGRIAEFLRRGEAVIAAAVPEASIVAFGHLGDGNLHYNLVFDQHVPEDEFDALRISATECVYDLVTEMGGSISAEHGIGVLKKPWLERYKSDVELDLMRTLKDALDPKGILNPGKVV